MWHRCVIGSSTRSSAWRVRSSLARSGRAVRPFQRQCHGTRSERSQVGGELARTELGSGPSLALEAPRPAAQNGRGASPRAHVTVVGRDERHRLRGWGTQSRTGEGPLEGRSEGHITADLKRPRRGRPSSSASRSRLDPSMTASAASSSAAGREVTRSSSTATSHRGPSVAIISQEPWIDRSKARWLVRRVESQASRFGRLTSTRAELQSGVSMPRSDA